MGPLEGVRVIELAGIGPAPFAAMMLADMGADVVRVDRMGRGTGVPASAPQDVLNRNRRSVVVDLKHPEGVETVLRLVEQADALVEGYRPGVCERLGVGPDPCLARNPRLVYGRMTGWGQEGPWAQAAGHDINYIALAGVLGHVGRADGGPVPPLNLVGDFGGGGVFLAFGVVCGVLEARRSGAGQVVDAAMVDGSAVLMTMMYAFRAMGLWDTSGRARNLLDTGAHFYDAYECADGEYVTIGPIEPQFYAELLDRLGLDPAEFPQYDRSRWPELKARIADVIRARTRDEWTELLATTDVCFAPVLSMEEAHRHPHLAARGTFVEHGGILQPAPAPRFSRTPPQITRGPAIPGADTDEALGDWGFGADEVDKLRRAGAIA